MKNLKNILCSLCKSDVDGFLGGMLQSLRARLNLELYSFALVLL